MTYKTEFPDYPESDMPPLPEGFADTSWHNDSCPSYSNPTFQIMIDYADSDQREVQGTCRFTVIRIDSDYDCGIATDSVFETDNWDDVLEYVTDEMTMQSVMAKLGLYIITDSSEPRVGTMYHVMQGNVRVKLAYDESEMRDFILSKRND